MHLAGKLSRQIFTMTYCFRNGKSVTHSLSGNPRESFPLDRLHGSGHVKRIRGQDDKRHWINRMAALAGRPTGQCA
jgi:hypothetical protein